MNFEKCTEIIDKYKDVISNITFFGGEPLLYKDLIFQIIDYTKKYNFNYTINTNATKIDTDIITLAKSNNILLNVSLDGNEQSNSANRFEKTQFDKVLYNIKTLIDNDINTIINYVISPNNIDYFCSSIKFFKESNLSNIFLMINYDAKWSKDDIEKLKANLFESIEIIDYLKIHPIYEKMHLILKGEKMPKCNFGKSNIVVSPNGKIYPCISFIDNIDYEIKDNTKDFKNIVDISKCVNCKYEKYCVNNCMCRYLYSNNESELNVNCETEKIFIDIAYKIISKKLQF